MLQDTDALKSGISLMKSRIVPWLDRTMEVNAELWEANAVPEGHYLLRRQETWRLARLKVRDPSHEQVFSLLDELCDYYLMATPDERTTVRNLFDADTLMSLFYYAHSAGDQIKSSGDTNWLRRGLAAVSIADNRLDIRDAGDVMRDLCMDAVRAGIDPRPFLREVGRMSSTFQRQGGLSAWLLLMDFADSSDLKDAVETHIPKP
jgi:hypothetical protein